MTENKIIGIIPARFGSLRFPGKMLAQILGKSLIQRTYENAARASSLDSLLVATDDVRIQKHVESFGGNVCMTSPACATGTDRVAEAAEALFPDAQIIVNIQGDEPLIDPAVIDTLVKTLLSKPESVLTTPIAQIHSLRHLFSPSVVKCAFAQNGRALYFSRAPLPYLHRKESLPFRHLGIYCFRREFLRTFVNLPSTPLQEAEDLEQLKVLEHGYPIDVCVVEDQSPGVDTPEDIKRLEQTLCKENTSSQPVAASRR